MHSSLQCALSFVEEREAQRGRQGPTCKNFAHLALPAPLPWLRRRRRRRRLPRRPAAPRPHSSLPSRISFVSLLPLGEGAKGGGGGLWWPWLCAKMGEEREGCAKIKCIARFLEGGGGWLQILLLLLPRAIGLGPDELWQKSYRREGVRSECTRSHSFPLGGTFFGTRFLLMSFLLFSKWAAIY